jgi:hypothetical protein
VRAAGWTTADTSDLLDLPPPHLVLRPPAGGRRCRHPFPPRPPTSTYRAGRFAPCRAFASQAKGHGAGLDRTISTAGWSTERELVGRADLATRLDPASLDEDRRGDDGTIPPVIMPAIPRAKRSRLRNQPSRSGVTPFPTGGVEPADTCTCHSLVSVRSSPGPTFTCLSCYALLRTPPPSIHRRQTLYLRNSCCPNRHQSCDTDTSPSW